MIFDCFLFFNELDLLELRLKYLDRYVDYFLISESDYLFGTKTKKPLNFLKNKDRFKKWEHKIIYNIVNDVPDSFVDYDKLYGDDIMKNKVFDILRKYSHYSHNEWHWANEAYQRECILMGLNKAVDDDIIMVSDLDEIPNIKILEKLDFPENNHFNIKCTQHQFYIDCVQLDEEWNGTNIFKKKYVYNIGLNGMRMNKQLGINIKNGGWHFSYLGGVDQIKQKIKASGHQEFNNNRILSNIDKNIVNNTDLYERGFHYSNISLEFLPNDLKKIVLEYPQFIKGNI